MTEFTLGDGVRTGYKPPPGSGPVTAPNHIVHAGDPGYAAPRGVDPNVLSGKGDRVQADVEEAWQAPEESGELLSGYGLATIVIPERSRKTRPDLTGT